MANLSGFGRQSYWPPHIEALASNAYPAGKECAAKPERCAGAAGENADL